MRIIPVTSRGWEAEVAVNDGVDVHHVRHFSKVSYSVRKTMVQDGTWVLHDVHIVTQHLVRFMAELYARDPHVDAVLILASPGGDASLEWARFLLPSVTFTLPADPSPSERHVEVVYKYRSGVRAIDELMQDPETTGDILVFLSCERECREWMISAPSNLSVLLVSSAPIPADNQGRPRVLLCSTKYEGRRFPTVQHVIDSGKAYTEMADTGIDWETTYITKSVAESRRYLAKDGTGKCHRLYPESVLRTQALFPSNLKRSMVGVDSVPAHMPLGPWAQPSSKTTATYMKTCRVPEPLASLFHLGVAGVKVAAMIYHRIPIRPGSVPRINALLQPYHQTLLRWGRALELKVCTEDVRVTYDEVMDWIHAAYGKRTLLRRLAETPFWVHVTTHEVLRLADTTDADMVIYTHRVGQTVMSFLKYRGSEPKAALGSATYHVPVDMLVHDVPIVTGGIVRVLSTTTTKGSQVRVDFLQECFHEVNRDMQTWLASVRLTTLDYPWCLPIDDQGTHVVVTGGMRITDVLSHGDRLPRLAIPRGTPIKGRPTRTGFEPTCIQDTVDQPELSPRSTTWPRRLTSEVHPDLPVVTSGVTLEIRFYYSPSHGRGYIQPDHVDEARLHLPETWVMEESRLGRFHISGFPLHMDEYDLSRTLHIPMESVVIHRKTHFVPYDRETAARGKPKGIKPFLEAMSSHLDLKNLAVGNPEGTVVYTFHVRSIDHILEYPEPILDETMFQNQPIRLTLKFSVLKMSTDGNKSVVAELPLESDPAQRRHQHQEAHVLQDDMVAIKEVRTPLRAWDPDFSNGFATLPEGMTMTSSGPLVTVYGSTMEERRRFLENNVLPKPTDEAWPACPICFDDRTASYTLQACGCRYCPPCLSQYIAGRAYTCPTPECRTRISVDDLAHHMDPLTYQEVGRELAGWYSLRVPEVLWKCPGECGVYHPRPEDVVYCLSCSKEYCVYCSTSSNKPVESHAGYCNPTANEVVDEARRAGISTCPVCLTPVDKLDGCNHLVCPGKRCGAHLCNLCCHAFTNVPYSEAATCQVQEIQGDGQVLVVSITTWPHLPVPKVPLRLKTLYFPGKKVGDAFPISTYVYDHINECAGGIR